MLEAGRAVREVRTYVVELADEYFAEIADRFIIQAEVRVICHDVECETEVSQMNGSRFV